MHSPPRFEKDVFSRKAVKYLSISELSMLSREDVHQCPSKGLSMVAIEDIQAGLRRLLNGNHDFLVR